MALKVCGGASENSEPRALVERQTGQLARMYYGEGAGNRRKMIKAKVDQRSKDAAYKKAFDNHVSNTHW